MAPTPRDDPALTEIWKRLYSQYRATDQGMSVHAACARIAGEYNCSAYTVKYHVLEDFHTQAKEQSTRQYEKRRQRGEAVNGPTYADPTDKRKYHKFRGRLDRHFNDSLPEILPPERSCSIEELTLRIRAAFGGVRFHPNSIERKLRRYVADQQAERIRGPPYLIEVQDGLWRYSANRPSAAPKH